MQLYAAAGYIVLYTNPRGRTSYGEEFANLIHHKYPGEDYDDLMSAVDAAIAQGYVDADNLFVTGGSGGGVLTAWIVGKTDAVPRGGVAEAGDQLGEHRADDRHLHLHAEVLVRRSCRGRTRRRTGSARRCRWSAS